MITSHFNRLCNLCPFFRTDEAELYVEDSDDLEGVDDLGSKLSSGYIRTITPPISYQSPVRAKTGAYSGSSGGASGGGVGRDSPSKKDYSRKLPPSLPPQPKWT